MSNGIKNKKIRKDTGLFILYRSLYRTWILASGNADSDSGNSGKCSIWTSICCCWSDYDSNCCICYYGRN